MTDADAGPTPRLARIAVHPIEALDPVERSRARVYGDSGIDGDREYAMVDEEGAPVDGKRTADVHRIRADFGEDARTVTLRRESESDREARRFDLSEDHTAVEGWLSDHFGHPVELERRGGPGDASRHDGVPGPTLVSTATLREVASWFDGVDVREMRLRTRANLEVEGVEPFWEDCLVARGDQEVAVRIGDVTLRGAGPCRQSVVPTRDPHTGEEHEGFRQVFVDRRERTLPEWAEPAPFGGYFRLAVETRVPQWEQGARLDVGDEVHVLGERPTTPTTKVVGE